MIDCSHITNLDEPALARSLQALRKLDEASSPAFQAATSFLSSARRLGDFCRSHSADLVLGGIEEYELAPLCRDVDTLCEWLERATDILDRRIQQLEN
jgi:hypothetical protein